MTTEVFSLAFMVVTTFALWGWRRANLKEAASCLEKKAAERRSVGLQETLAEREQQAKRWRQDAIKNLANQIEAVKDGTVNFYRKRA